MFVILILMFWLWIIPWMKHFCCSCFIRDKLGKLNQIFVRVNFSLIQKDFVTHMQFLAVYFAGGFLIDTWLPLHQLWANHKDKVSLTQCWSLSIIYFELKATKSLVMTLDSKAQLSASVVLELGTFWFRVHVLSHCATLPYVKEGLLFAFD